MIQLDVKFERSELFAICVQLSELSEGVRPTEIAIDEQSGRSSISQEDLRAYDQLVRQYPNGSALYGADAEFHLSYSDAGGCSLFALFVDDGRARECLSRLAELNLQYGFACRPEEREHRNQVKAQKSYGAHEAWVGRDHLRCLPGIYWLNVLPMSLLETHGLKLDEFEDVAWGIKLVDGRNYVIELYSGSGQWVERAAIIDRWCEATAGVFHRGEAEIALRGASNFIEASNVLSRWR